MNAWERFRKWAACLIWPDVGKEVEQLAERLATAHERIQEMYWEEQAKEAATARIAGLEDTLWRCCVALHISGETVAAEQFCGEARIPWDVEKAEKWRMRIESVKDTGAGTPDALNVKITREETTAEQLCPRCGKYTVASVGFCPGCGWV